MGKIENSLSFPDLKKVQVRTPFIVFPQTWFTEIHVESSNGNVSIECESAENLKAENRVEGEVGVESKLVPEFTIVDLQDAFRSPLSTMEP